MVYFRCIPFEATVVFYLSISSDRAENRPERPILHNDVRHKGQRDAQAGHHYVTARRVGNHSSMAMTSLHARLTMNRFVTVRMRRCVTTMQQTTVTINFRFRY